MFEAPRVEPFFVSSIHRGVLSRRTEYQAVGYGLRETEHHLTAACPPFRRIACSGRSAFSPPRLTDQNQRHSPRNLTEDGSMREFFNLDNCQLRRYGVHLNI